MKVKNSTCRRLVDNEIKWKCSTDNTFDWLLETETVLFVRIPGKRSLEEVGKNNINLTLPESSYMEALDFPK